MPPYTGSFENARGVYRWRLYRTTAHYRPGVALWHPSGDHSYLSWDGSAFVPTHALRRLYDADKAAMGSLRYELLKAWPVDAIERHYETLPNRTTKPAGRDFAPLVRHV